ncbi:MAG: hypothetical protein A4E43_00988 [Methanosaeta sp. PtaB.Bin005]|nr:MAG: hypothetical protein A4E43_00988 [Methanosaeta sp. PtaB.Bin005]
MTRLISSELSSPSPSFIRQWSHLAPQLLVTSMETVWGTGLPIAVLASFTSSLLNGPLGMGGSQVLATRSFSLTWAGFSSSSLWFTIFKIGWIIRARAPWACRARASLSKSTQRAGVLISWVIRTPFFSAVIELSPRGRGWMKLFREPLEF